MTEAVHRSHIPVPIEEADTCELARQVRRAILSDTGAGDLHIHSPPPHDPVPRLHLLRRIFFEERSP